MRTYMFRVRAAATAAIAFGSFAYADELVLPPNAPTTAGSGGYSTLLHSQERSYQLVVGSGILGGLPVGSQITGVAFRRPSWQVFSNWPGAGFTAVFQNYDISLSSSLNPPGSLSSNYLENVGPDVVQVRAGQISFADAYFPGGAASPAVNVFCEPITFATPYVYTGASGGHLLLTLRHTGNNVGASGSLDWLGSSGNGQAIGVSSYTQATGWYAQGNNGMVVLKLVFTPPGACTGDITGDGKVCQDDLGVLLAAYGTCEGDPGYNAAANLATSPSALCSPGTQGIDQADLGLLLGDFGCGGCP